MIVKEFRVWVRKMFAPSYPGKNMGMTTEEFHACCRALRIAKEPHQAVMTMDEFHEWARDGQQREAADPEARKFRDTEMEASRQAFIGLRREDAVEHEPETGTAPMPVAPDVGESLVCTNPDCNGATEGDDPQWSPLAISPQGRWRRDRWGWLHHCRAEVWSEAVNPWGSEQMMEQTA